MANLIEMIRQKPAMAAGVIQQSSNTFVARYTVVPGARPDLIVHAIYADWFNEYGGPAPRENYYAEVEPVMPQLVRTKTVMKLHQFLGMFDEVTILEKDN